MVVCFVKNVIVKCRILSNQFQVTMCEMDKVVHLILTSFRQPGLSSTPVIFNLLHDLTVLRKSIKNSDRYFSSVYKNMMNDTNFTLEKTYVILFDYILQVGEREAESHD